VVRCTSERPSRAREKTVGDLPHLTSDNWQYRKLDSAPATIGVQLHVSSTAQRKDPLDGHFHFNGKPPEKLARPSAPAVDLAAILDNETRVKFEQELCEGLAFLERHFRDYATQARKALDGAEDQRDVDGTVCVAELEDTLNLRFSIDWSAAGVDRELAKAVAAAKALIAHDEAELEDALRRGVLVRMPNGDLVSPERADATRRKRSNGKRETAVVSKRSTRTRAKR
jgi:hypothetical protein